MTTSLQDEATLGLAREDVSRALDNVRLEGDTGQLPMDTRRALVQLLRGPAIDIKRHPNLWKVLLRDQVVLTSRMHELFLDLVVDTRQ